MKHLFIPYEQALELKELEFNEPCLAVTHRDGTLCSLVPAFTRDSQVEGFASIKNSECLWEDDQDSINGIQEVATPTYSQAFRWFREKHNIKISIDYKSTDEICYFYKISFQRLANGENPPVMIWHHCDSWLGLNKPLSTYEEAEIDCLKKLIEIAKNK